MWTKHKLSLLELIVEVGVLARWVGEWTKTNSMLNSTKIKSKDEVGVYGTNNQYLQSEITLYG